MSSLRKVFNDDGTITILADGSPVRSTVDHAEADEIVRALSYLVAEDDERPAGR